MNLRSAFLAQKAVANPDGTFDVVRGGITDFAPTGGVILGRPFHLEFALVVRVELSVEEVEQLQVIQMQVVFQDEPLGEPASLPMAAPIVPGERRYHHNLIMNMKVDVPTTGEGYIHLSWDGGMVSVPRIYFRVGMPRG